MPSRLRQHTWQSSAPCLNSRLSLHLYLTCYGKHFVIQGLLEAELRGSFFARDSRAVMELPCDLRTVASLWVPT